MSKIEYGVVKFFKSDKKFGFITVLDADGCPTKIELFFHYNSGCFLQEGGDEPEFGSTTITVNRNVMRIKPPDKGTRLVFIRGCDDKGEKVDKWGYAVQYDSIVEAIASRPTYRLVRSSSNYGKDTSGVVWQGRNIIELSAEYPKWLHFGKVCDSVASGSADSGDMYWRYRFEELVNDSWQLCSDPRRFLHQLPRRVQDAVAHKGGRELKYDQ